jgi:hypothetical protein
LYYETDAKILSFCSATDTWTEMFRVGADGYYYADFTNNSTYTPVAGKYRFLFTGGVPYFDENGTARVAVREAVATGGIILGDSTPDAAGELGYDAGKFCMYGANSEDLCIEPGNASNTSVVSSGTGVTKLGFSALNLVTTGTISGKIPSITKSDDYTLGTDDAQEAYGYMVWMSGNKTLTLPAVSAGMSVCVYSTDATAKMIDPNANDGIRNGTASRNADGHKITSAGAAGDFACLVADSADGWTVLGKSGTWTDE